MIIDLDKVTVQERTQWSHLLMQLHDKRAISTKTMLTEMGLDYEEEMKRLLSETENQKKIDEAFNKPI